VASALSVIVVVASGPGEPFPDVSENAYYTDSVYKMRDLGVVTGYENGNFGPSDYVTRGQLITMLARYDEALLDPPWPSKSGIFDLHQVVCSGGLDFNINNEGIQQAYNRLCDTP
jgi:hypothetical protein